MGASHEPVDELTTYRFSGLAINTYKENFKLMTTSASAITKVEVNINNDWDKRPLNKNTTTLSCPDFQV